jgi:hypothetical protein
MRHAIETAPRDRKFVILEDDASGSYVVAHWSPEAGECVGKNGEPSKITPTQREIETQAAQLGKASEETGQLKQAEAAKIAQSLGQKRENTAAVAQEAAAARQELTTSTAKHRQALEEGRARSAALSSEMAMAQREIETQAALLKASEETAAKSAQSLRQEREKMAAFAQPACEFTASWPGPHMIVGSPCVQAEEIRFSTKRLLQYYLAKSGHR